MNDRKIHEAWVEETIKSPNLTIHEGNKFYATKKLNGKTLRVVYIKDKDIKVITTFFIK